MFRVHDRLKPAYDAVIIGGGGHGLAAAYYLARDHGMTNVAVLEKGYLGGGNTGRNTTIIRSNYLTPEGVAFYDESVRLFQDLAEDFDLNLFYSDPRPLHPGAHRLGDAHHALARGGEQALGRGQRAGRPGLRQAVLSADRPHLRRACTDPGRALPRARRHRAARRGGLGLRPRRRPARRGDPPADRSHGHRRARRQGRRRAHQPRHHLDAEGALRGGRLHAAHDSTWSGCARRSTSIRCRRW